MTSPNFADFFSEKFAVTPRDIRKCNKLRYNVYVKQQQFEPPNKEKVERDALDAQAFHTLITLSNGSSLATARLLKDDMPVYDYIDHQLLPHPDECLELSRFCCDQQKLRKVIRTLSRKGEKYRNQARQIKKLAYLISPAIMRQCFAKAKELNRPYLVGITESRFIARLENEHFDIKRLGDPVKYHGIRQGFIIDIEGTLQKMNENDAHLKDFMANTAKQS
ncbi:MAG: hypothetical protein CMF60_03455 [Magnetococcales bacterium]|nr:hypothetical protein [Magnetococcales bacterium]MEC8067048.1 GNAT family N-acyltransferase [Pseudomonadota bacterium]|tara:strand:- start:67613 stop:68275 length:663 start_codon:yes stop_codon:yes gene_type:complete